MKKIVPLALCLLLIVGCAYNSRNMMRFTGSDMKLSYGLISAEHLTEVILLRETNAGEGEAKYNIPSMNEYIHIPIDGKVEIQGVKGVELADIVKEEVKVDNADPVDNP